MSSRSARRQTRISSRRLAILGIFHFLRDFLAVAQRRRWPPASPWLRLQRTLVALFAYLLLIVASPGSNLLMVSSDVLESSRLVTPATTLEQLHVRRKISLSYLPNWWGTIQRIRLPSDGLLTITRRGFRR